jgi:DNA polymerase V
MDIIEVYSYQPGKMRLIPFFSMSVSAGVPSPVDDDIDKVVDLNEFLVEHPAATFFARVKGNTLSEIGISDNDILIVDTVIEPEDGKVVVASINGDLTVKIFRNIDGEEFLQSGNLQFHPIRIEPYLEYEIMGVVTKVIHSL